MTAALVQQTIRVCLSAQEDNARIEVSDAGLEQIVSLQVSRGDDGEDSDREVCMSPLKLAPWPWR